MADVKWIKITTDIFADEKILLIESLPEADTIITIWFKLLCLAGRQNNSGVFIANNMPYTDEMFATIFRRPLNVVKLALQTFEQFGMVEIINNVYTIPNWEKHQSLDKMEEIKEQTRIRVANYRERQKLLSASSECNVTSNATVTQSNAIDKDIDKNKNKNISKDIYSDLDSEVVDVLKEFEKMRKQIKKPMTDRAIEMLITKLKGMSSEKYTQIAILDQSITHCWQDIYELKAKDSAYASRLDKANIRSKSAEDQLKAYLGDNYEDYL